MGSLEIFFVLAFAQCIISDPVFRDNCAKTKDFSRCVKKSLQFFIQDHYAGIPDKNVEPIDPITIPELFETRKEFKTEFKNVKVTGYKDMIISHVATNRNTGTCEVTMKTNVTIEGDVTYTNNIVQKNYSGTFKYEGHVICVAKYNFNMKKKNDLDIYDLGSETITCEADNVKATFNKELLEALMKDMAEKEENYEEQAIEHYKRTLCMVAEVPIKTFINNIRTLLSKGV